MTQEGEETPKSATRRGPRDSQRLRPPPLPERPTSGRLPVQPAETSPATKPDSTSDNDVNIEIVDDVEPSSAEQQLNELTRMVLYLLEHSQLGPAERGQSTVRASHVLTSLRAAFRNRAPAAADPRVAELEQEIAKLRRERETDDLVDQLMMSSAADRSLAARLAEETRKREAVEAEVRELKAAATRQTQRLVVPPAPPPGPSPAQQAARVASLVQELDKVIAERDRARIDLSNTTTKLNQLKPQITQLAADCDRLRSERDLAQSAIDLARAQADESKKEVQAAKVDEARAKQAEAEAKAAKAEQAEKAAKGRYADLQASTSKTKAGVPIWVFVDPAAYKRGKGKTLDQLIEMFPGPSYGAFLIDVAKAVQAHLKAPVSLDDLRAKLTKVRKDRLDATVDVKLALPDALARGVEESMTWLCKVHEELGLLGAQGARLDGELKTASNDAQVWRRRYEELFASADRAKLVLIDVGQIVLPVF